MRQPPERVWIVEVGDYSDCHVVCVCDSEEQAERVAKKIGGDFSEWPINTLDLSEGDRRRPYEVMLNPENGSRWEARPDGGWEALSEPPSIQHGWYAMGKTRETLWYITVLAENARHATKIAKEKWAVWKAEEHLGVDP